MATDKDWAALMCWAIEQAVALHSRSGVTTEVLLSEARKIVEFVESATDDGPEFVSPEDRKSGVA